MQAHFTFPHPWTCELVNNGYDFCGLQSAFVTSVLHDISDLFISCTIITIMYYFCIVMVLELWCCTPLYSIPGALFIVVKDRG